MTGAHTLAEQVDRIGGRRATPALVLDGSLDHPDTGVVLSERRATAAAAVDEALAVADELHRTGAWRRRPAAERAAQLRELAAALDARAEGLAVQESLSTGIPVSVTRPMCASFGDAVRGVAARLEAGLLHAVLPGAVRPVHLHRLPWGPAVLLPAWNAPTALAVGKVANALAAGCPAVLKPSEWAPAGAGVLADAAEAAGLPPGVLQLVHGDGGVGAQLVADRRTRVVSFTGSQATGRAIARASIERFPALQLELGGNNPVVVRADADVAATAEALAAGMTKLNGQWCEAPGKVLVAARLHDALVAALLDALARRRIGPCLDDATEIGPLAHRRHRDHLDAQVARLGALGGEVHRAGALPALGGWFFAPAVVTGVPAAHASEELFGPVVTVHPVAGDDEAVGLANAADDGLAAYVFSADLDAAEALGAELHAGEVKVNGTSLLDLTAGSAQSFWGASGLGGHGGDDVLRAFTGARIVGVDDPGAPI